LLALLSGWLWLKVDKMTDKRKLTEQIKSLKRMLDDIDKFSEILAQEAIRTKVQKGRNILAEMKEANKVRRNIR